MSVNLILIKDKLNRISLPLKKIILSKIMKKKYFREGKCNLCGKCCQHIYIRHSDKIIKNEVHFEALKSQHFFYSYLKVIETDETGLIFECTKLDKEKGACTAYEQRPLLCRQYPNEAVFMMGVTISKECGFKFVPIYSFEEVFEKIQNSDIKKEDLQ